MLKLAKRFLLRSVYSMGVRCGLTRSLASFFPLWEVSDAIYVGPAGPAARIYPELLALRQVISAPDISDAELYSQLSHPSPWVVGYCFEALLARRSPLLSGMPTSLQARSELVCLGITCFRCIEPLHSYVAHRLAATFHRDSEDPFVDASRTS
jgi:hypothetical protein